MLTEGHGSRYVFPVFQSNLEFLDLIKSVNSIQNVIRYSSEWKKTNLKTLFSKGKSSRKAHFFCFGMGCVGPVCGCYMLAEHKPELK